MNYNGLNFVILLLWMFRVITRNIHDIGKRFLRNFSSYKNEIFVNLLKLLFGC